MPMPVLLTKARIAVEPYGNWPAEVRAHRELHRTKYAGRDILQECTHFRSLGSREQVCPHVFRANGVGLCFLIVLAQIERLMAIEKLNPMMRPSRVSTAVTIRSRSWRTSSSIFDRRLRKRIPIPAPKKEKTKTRRGNLIRLS
jgi:hypothetical protein